MSVTDWHIARRRRNLVHKSTEIQPSQQNRRNPTSNHKTSSAREVSLFCMNKESGNMHPYASNAHHLSWERYTTTEFPFRLMADVQKQSNTVFYKVVKPSIPFRSVHSCSSFVHPLHAILHNTTLRVSRPTSSFF